MYRKAKGRIKVRIEMIEIDNKEKVVRIFYFFYYYIWFTSQPSYMFDDTFLTLQKNGVLQL